MFKEFLPRLPVTLEAEEAFVVRKIVSRLVELALRLRKQRRIRTQMMWVMPPEVTRRRGNGAFVFVKFLNNLWKLLLIQILKFNTSTNI